MASSLHHYDYERARQEELYRSQMMNTMRGDQLVYDQHTMEMRRDLDRKMMNTKAMGAPPTEPNPLLLLEDNV
jgi:hypothetical protein